MRKSNFPHARCGESFRENPLKHAIFLWVWHQIAGEDYSRWLRFDFKSYRRITRPNQWSKCGQASQNEVERFIREKKKREASQRAQDKEQATIQRLTQKTVTAMAGEQIDPSEIPKGHYAYIVYTTQGATGRTLSHIADRDASHITLKYGEDLHIAYSAIDTLIVAKDLRALDSYRERGTEYNVRVRVYAPSIEKDQIVGKVLKMKQDTLVIQRGRSFYGVPVSSISKFDVSIGQYRNTGKGFLIGFAAGAFLAIWINGPDHGEGDLQDLAELLATAIYVPPIVVIPTLVGAIIKSDKWVEVSPQRFNLSLAPTSAKGLRAALTFNFF